MILDERRDDGDDDGGRGGRLGTTRDIKETMGRIGDVGGDILLVVVGKDCTIVDTTMHERRFIAFVTYD